LPRFVFTSGANGAASSSVTLAGRRYVVCRNHQEAEKDAADQAAIVAALTLRPLAPTAEHRSLPIQFRHCRGHATLNPSVEPSIMYLSQLVHTAWENING